MSELPRLPLKEALILGMIIASDRPLFGKELVEASSGKLKLKSVYITLQRMEDKGLLESEKKKRKPPEIGIPRRFYQPTEHGRRVHLAYETARNILASLNNAGTQGEATDI